jgi:hypothetical protein
MYNIPLSFFDVMDRPNSLLSYLSLIAVAPF